MAHRTFAVVIGVDGAGATAGVPTLRYAVDDAEAIRDILGDPDIGTFDSDDIQLFVGVDATAARIKSTLRRIAVDSDRSDVLLVYFAGHTMTPSWSHDTDLYLVTADFDESALSHDPDAGLRMTFLKRDVLEYFAGTALLILDCCRAGNLLTVAGGDVDMISFGGRSEARYSALMACSSDGYAREDAASGHGAFTHHVLRALRGQAQDRQGQVTFHAMCNYVLEQQLDPRPGVLMQSWGGTTVLTRPHSPASGRHAAPPVPDEMEIVRLANPLDPHVTRISELIGRLEEHARRPLPAPRSRDDEDTTVLQAARVQYLKLATQAEAVALLEFTDGGFQQIDATARFDLETALRLLRHPTDPRFPLDPDWFGHVARAGEQTLLCVPVDRAADKVLLLAVVNLPAELLAIGEPVVKIFETLWRADFAARPAEAEVGVLTAIRRTFGRLPAELYERCFRRYRQVLESLDVVFQPIITIGPTHRHVGVHSYEALARRSPQDLSAPVNVLQVAHAWGDRFVVERDVVIARKALTAYASAHASSRSWDLPKPVSVNVSVRSLLSDAYVTALQEAIAAADLDPSAVTLEIAEQDPIEPRSGEKWLDPPHTYFHNRLAAIARDVGVGFAVDDFGSGYASVSRMAELPLTQIKVDRAILHHPRALQELSLVVDVARHAMERGETHAPRVVIVEGVDFESPLTLRQIYDRNIKHVQGYITRQPAGRELRPMTVEARQEIAARVRGDDEKRPAGLARGDSAGGGDPLRRGA